MRVPISPCSSTPLTDPELVEGATVLYLVYVQYFVHDTWITSYDRLAQGPCVFSRLDRFLLASWHINVISRPSSNQQADYQAGNQCLFLSTTSFKRGVYGV